jgi:hypothetical protein
MQLDPNPTFRKPITPWYDSNFSCWALIAFLIVVLVFALNGFLVALYTPQFSAHLWFPLFLGGLSLLLIVKIFLRLHRRAKNN